MDKQIPFYSDINRDFEVSFASNIGNKRIDFHFHKSYEIYFCWTDDMQYLVNNKLYNINKGDLLIFNNMDIHKSLPPVDRQYERYMVLFNPEYIENYSTKETDLLKCFSNHNKAFNHLVRLKAKDQEKFLTLFHQVQKAMDSSNYGSDIRKKMALVEILLLINAWYEQNNAFQTLETNRHKNEMSELLLYIQEHIEQQIKLDDLSKKFLINKNLLNKRFKEYTGFSINQYIIQYRIMIAKRYLQNGETVTETANKVGYTNLSHFIRTFHQLVGMSPKQYSKQAR